jgi:hypothetical protein
MAEIAVPRDLFGMFGRCAPRPTRTDDLSSRRNLPDGGNRAPAQQQRATEDDRALDECGEASDGLETGCTETD